MIEVRLITRLEKKNMTKELIMASIGLSLFIVCPRMAGMVNVIAKHSQVSLIYVALLGSILAVPLIVATF